MTDPTATLSPQNLASRILYDRGGVVVVDKPPGIPSTGHQLSDPDSVQFALIQRHGEMTWAVHQLDADTSGLNVFVREKKLVSQWQRRMRFPHGKKTYIAVVHGEVAANEHLVDAAIGVVDPGPPEQLGITPSGRSARTRIDVLDRAPGCSLLRVQIETGRTHQIRIHLASLGHPLLGEEWYRQPSCERHHRQALHAWKLEFEDPTPPRELHCPLPPDLLDLLNSCSLTWPGPHRE